MLQKAEYKKYPDSLENPENKHLGYRFEDILYEERCFHDK